MIKQFSAIVTNFPDNGKSPTTNTTLLTPEGNIETDREIDRYRKKKEKERDIDTLEIER